MRLTCVLLFSFGALGAEGPTLSREQQEDFLRNARILNTRLVGSGITNSMRATLSDGRLTHDAHIQQVDVFKPEHQVRKGVVERNFKDTYRFNIAAYQLAKLLDLDVVPVSVERQVNGRPAAVTWWVDDLQMTERQRRDKDMHPPDFEGWNNQIYMVSVFDALIENTDRTQENLLITNGWQIRAIDHTRAFRENHAIREPKRLVRCNVALLENLRKLNPAQVRDTLYSYLTVQEIDAIVARRDLIVKLFDSAVAAQGNDAVLTGLPRKTPSVSVP